MWWTPEDCVTELHKRFVSLNKFNETKIYNEKQFAACNSFFFFIRQKIIKLV